MGEDLEKVQFLSTAADISPTVNMEDVTTYVNLSMYYQRNANWWLGDLVNYALHRWGDLGWQCVNLHYSPDHVQRVAAVCKSIPPDRRNMRLSWTHHALVSKLQPVEQVYFLDLAEENKWTTSDLKAALRTHNKDMASC